ncbi:MAG: hypothetical protein EZS28_012449, partial [Streblomastix strix]
MLFLSGPCPSVDLDYISEKILKHLYPKYQIKLGNSYQLRDCDKEQQFNHLQLSPQETLASPLYFEIAKWVAGTGCCVELPISIGRPCIKIQKESVKKLLLEVPIL